MTGRYIELALDKYRSPFQAMSDALFSLKHESQSRLEEVWRTTPAEWASESFEDIASFETVKRYCAELSKILS
jgi:hypothetical protein